VVSFFPDFPPGIYMLTYLLRGFSPRANYTDRATAACQRR
jgi:hypothetical protein